MSETIETVRRVHIKAKDGSEQVRYAIQDRELGHWLTYKPLKDLSWSRALGRRKLWDTQVEAEAALAAVRAERKKTHEKD